MQLELIDLSATLEDGIVTYPGNKIGLETRRIEIGTKGGQLSRFTLFDPHCGTHLDAPRHFLSSGKDVSELPLVILPAAVADVSGHTFGPEPLSGLGRLRGRALLVHTGWDAHAGTPAYFRGYPCPTPEAAHWLVEEGIALLGLDTPSADPVAASTEYPIHETILGAGVPIVEGLVGLERLIGRDDLFFVGFPLKIKGLEGSPIRAAALAIRT